MLPGGPLRFESSGPACIVFDAQYLAPPLRRAALRTLVQRALPLTVRPYRRDRLLAQRVRELLRAEEGAALQALKDAVRRYLAVDALTRTSRAVKQVALAVGFRNEKNFSRAFRGWTGQSTAAYRRSATRS